MSKWTMAALVAILAGFGVMRIWADVPVPASQPSEPNFVRTSTPIDRALRAMDLTDEAKVNVEAVLKEFMVKETDRARPIFAKLSDLQEQKNNEPDQAKRNELAQKYRELANSVDPADRYRSVKAALKGVLSDEQLAKIDETVKSGVIGLMVDHMNHYVAWLEKTVPDFKLDDSQKAKLADAIKAAREKLVKEDAAVADQKGKDAILELHRMLMNDLLSDAQRKQFMQYLGRTRPPGQGNASQPAGQSI